MTRTAERARKWLKKVRTDVDLLSLAKALDASIDDCPSDLRQEWGFILDVAEAAREQTQYGHVVDERSTVLPGEGWVSDDRVLTFDQFLLAYYPKAFLVLHRIADPRKHLMHRDRLVRAVAAWTYRTSSRRDA